MKIFSSFLFLFLICNLNFAAAPNPNPNHKEAECVKAAKSSEPLLTLWQRPWPTIISLSVHINKGKPTPSPTVTAKANDWVYVMQKNNPTDSEPETHMEWSDDYFHSRKMEKQKQTTELYNRAVELVTLYTQRTKSTKTKFEIRDNDAVVEIE